jgi:hypothetical protein
MPPHTGELPATRMLFVAAIALAQPSWISVHAANVSAEAKAAVEEAITELGCSMDVDDQIEANGDRRAAHLLPASNQRHGSLWHQPDHLPIQSSSRLAANCFWTVCIRSLKAFRTAALREKT